jgi:hypothetical protein
VTRLACPASVASAPRDRRLRLGGLTLELRGRALGLLLRDAQLVELLELDARGCFAARLLFFGALEDLDERLALCGELLELRAQLLLLGERHTAPLVEHEHLLARPFELGLVHAHVVVGAERGGVGGLGALFGRVRGLSVDLEPCFACVERGAALLLLFGRALERVQIDLRAHGELEQLVRSLVQHEVVELLAVAHVALGLGGLALERRESARSRSRCRRHAAGSAASGPSSVRPACGAPCTS